MRDPATTRDIGAGLPPTRFFWGARYAIGGVSWVFKHRPLLVVSLAPMLVQAALFGLCVWAAFAFVMPLVYSGTEPGHWYSFLIGALRFVVAVLLVAASVVLSMMLGGVLCDPFYDLLSERTESLMIGRDVSTPITLLSVLRGIGAELVGLPWRLLLYLLLMGPLWLLTLTGVGSFIAVPLSLAWSWLFVAHSSLSRSFARHSVGRRSRFWSVFRMPSTALGFGAIGWLFSHLPLTSPFLIVGATRLFLNLAAFDRIPNTLTEAEKYTLRQRHGAAE